MSSNLRHNGKFATRHQYAKPRMQVVFGLVSFVTLSGIMSYQPKQAELFSQPETIVVRASELSMGSAPTPAPLTSVEDKIRAKFGKNADIAVAVARAESGLREDAIGDHTLDYRGKDGKVYGASYGVFQIRSLPGRAPVRDLLTAEKNIEHAYKMSKGGTDWNAWSAYKNGSYKQFMGGK